MLIKPEIEECLSESAVVANIRKWIESEKKASQLGFAIIIAKVKFILLKGTFKKEFNYVTDMLDFLIAYEKGYNDGLKRDSKYTEEEI